MPIYLDVTYLGRRERQYVRMLLKRNPKIFRRVYLRFASDGVNSWKALRALANVYRNVFGEMEFVDERHRHLVSSFSFHPDVRELAKKQKLSKAERDKLGRRKNAIRPGGW